MNNVEYVIEFSKDKPLAEFVDKMTKNRIQATRDGIDELAQLFKVSFWQNSKSKVFFS